jgi:hypothetical protein
MKVVTYIAGALASLSRDADVGGTDGDLDPFA